jgi:hypothetical protein
MVDADPSIRRQVLLRLEQQPSWPREVWAKVPELLSDSDIKLSSAMGAAIGGREISEHEALVALSIDDPKVTSHIVDSLNRRKVWSPKVWDQMIVLLKDPRHQASVIVGLKRRAKLPDAAWAEIPALMRHSNDLLRLRVTELLVQHFSDWTEQVWKGIPALLSDPFVQKPIIKALIEHQMPSEELWKQMPAMLKDKDHYYARRAAIKILENQNQWSDDFLNNANKLEDELDNEIKVEFAKLRKEQALKQRKPLWNRAGCILDNVKSKLF